MYAPGTVLYVREEMSNVPNPKIRCSQIKLKPRATFVPRRRPSSHQNIKLTMPRCALYTGPTQLLKPLVLPDRFPDDVIALEVGVDPRKVSELHPEISYENLANMLTNTPSRLDKIEINRSLDRSSECLRFVSLACHKTTCFIVRDRIENPQWYECLNANLANGGVEEFSFDLYRISPQDLSSMRQSLFHGIALSRSLKKFTVSMECISVLGNQLIRALEQNQSLRALDVFAWSPVDAGRNDNRLMQAIFRTTVQSTRVRDLSLRGAYMRTEDTAILDERVFMDCLCDPSCSIEKLHLDEIKLQREPTEILDLFYDIDDSISVSARSLQEFMQIYHLLICSFFPF